MIRGLYQHMDQHFKNLEEKFKKDELELRIKFDKEIKNQMSKKLKELKYKNSDIYKEDFLYEIGKTTMFRNLDKGSNENNKFSYNFTVGNQNPNDIFSFYGFFNNISKLNNDVSLNDDEYVIGLFGSINFSSDYKYRLKGMLNLKVITNYLNVYSIIKQYNDNNGNLNKGFNETFQLKNIRKNDMKLFDEQVDNIITIFNKITLIFDGNYNGCDKNNYTTYTHYYPKLSIYIDLIHKKKIFEKDLKETYNYNSLPEECINLLNDNKFLCCKKCFKDANNKQTKKYNDSTNKILSYLNTQRLVINSLSNEIYESNQVKYLLDPNVYQENEFNIFEKQFNDFWADKIQEINGDSKADISMAQLIEHKDKTIDELKIENKLLKKENNTLDHKLKQNLNCKEYENQLKEQIKQLSQDVDKLNLQIKTKDTEKNDLDQKYTQLKTKIQSLMN